MGIVNQCMLKEEKSRIPSQIGSVYELPNDLHYYQETYKNSPLFNDYLQRQSYRTQVIAPSEKDSSLYNKMVNCSQPPSGFFDKLSVFKPEQPQAKVNQQYFPPKIRRTNYCQSQTVQRPKSPRRVGLPQSCKPTKVHEKDERQTHNQETFLQV